jgi:hypothetical protein
MPTGELAGPSLSQRCPAGQRVTRSGLLGESDSWQDAGWQSVPGLHEILVVLLQRFAMSRHYPAYWLDRPTDGFAPSQASSAVLSGCRKDGGERPWESRAPHDSRSAVFLGLHCRLLPNLMPVNELPSYQERARYSISLDVPRPVSGRPVEASRKPVGALGRSSFFCCARNTPRRSADAEGGLRSPRGTYGLGDARRKSHLAKYAPPRKRTK